VALHTLAREEIRQRIFCHLLASSSQACEPDLLSLQWQFGSAGVSKREIGFRGAWHFELLQAPMLDKGELLTHFSCLVLQHSSNWSKPVSKQNEYFCSSISWFSSVISIWFDSTFRSTTRSKKLFKIMLTKSNGISYIPKGGKEKFFNRELQHF
jgi:hypothetical protein